MVTSKPHGMQIADDGTAGFRPEAPPAILVHRRRVVELLDIPFQPFVVVVTAGAGFGKTTLVADWAASCDHQVRWVRVRPSDNHPTRFAARLNRAVNADRFPVTTWPDEIPPHSIAVHGDGAVGHSPKPRTIVIDQAEFLTDPASIACLDEALDSSSSQVRFIILARNPLPLRLGRLRAGGQVRELGRDDLAFTLDEAAEAIGHQVPLPVDSAEVARLWERVEGWPAGILLGGMAMWRSAARGRNPIIDEPSFVRFLDEYVEQEILSMVSPLERRFLLHASGLDVATSEMWWRIDGEAGDSLGRHLCARFPFAIAVDDDGSAFRVHSAVRESLQRLARELSAHDRDQVRKSIAAWHRDTGATDLAAELALAPGAGSWSGEMVHAHLRALFGKSRFEELFDIIDRTPGPIRDAYPEIDRWNLIARLALGHTFGMETVLAEMAPVWRASSDPTVQASAALCDGLLQYWHDDMGRAALHLERTLDQLPPSAVTERMYAATFRGRIETVAGRDDRSRPWLALAESCAMHLPIDEQWAWRIIALDRANLYAMRGDLTSAITKYEQVLAELPAVQANLEGIIRCRLVGLAIEQRRFHAAWNHLDAIEQLPVSGSQPWRNDAVIARVRIAMATGDMDSAQRLAAGSVKLMRRHPDKEQLVLSLARIWIDRRAFPLVSSWLEEIDSERDSWVRTFGDINHRMLAIDLALAMGDPGEAAAMAEHMTGVAEASSRWAEYVGFASRWAVCLDRLGYRQRATMQFDAALSRGVAGGFLQSLAVPGVDTTTLFANQWKGSPERLAARRSLSASAVASQQCHHGMLSARELEVLSMVAAGRSNQDIAARLFISRNTVRNHLVNISRRLDVHSRSEAVARARELELIG